jgi:hypothetical protein
MSKSNTTENDVLKAVLQGTDPSWRAQANLWVALYTANPDEAGTAITNETAYTNYVRKPIVKATGWTDGGSSFSNAAQIQFDVCGAVAGSPLTHVAIVTTANGAGQILYSGQLNDSLAIATLVQPQFAIGALVITED